jgi:phosphoribosyl-ATP pyrophosphohydrolase
LNYKLSRKPTTGHYLQLANKKQNKIKKKIGEEI